jgi:hypothetical protein
MIRGASTKAKGDGDALSKHRLAPFFAPIELFFRREFSLRQAGETKLPGL